MLLKLLRYVLLSLVLLLVFLGSALVAMRYAIHGREVRVPTFTGLTPVEAERAANAAGLVLSIESHFYSSVPQGRIVSQSPDAGALVRRGWKIMVAESLGPQRVAIPNVVGQSRHAAETNITHRGLEIGSIASMRVPGAQTGAVLAQTPSSDNKDAASPRISLLLAAPDSAPCYVMPTFIGKPLSEASLALERAGFTVGKATEIPGDAGQRPGMILHQDPPAGQKVAAGAAINFEVTK